MLHASLSGCLQCQGITKCDTPMTGSFAMFLNLGRLLRMQASSSLIPGVGWVGPIAHTCGATMPSPPSSSTLPLPRPSRSSSPSGCSRTPRYAPGVTGGGGGCSVGVCARVRAGSTKGPPQAGDAPREPPAPVALPHSLPAPHVNRSKAQRYLLLVAVLLVRAPALLCAGQPVLCKVAHLS